jgi:hypothetical protein
MCICARLQDTLPRVVADLSDYDDEKVRHWMVRALCAAHARCCSDGLQQELSLPDYQIARHCTGAEVVTLHLVVQTSHGIAETDVVVLWASPPCTAYSPLGRLRRKGEYTSCWRSRFHELTQVASTVQWMQSVGVCCCDRPTSMVLLTVKHTATRISNAIIMCRSSKTEAG